MQTIIVKGDLRKLRKKARLTFRQLSSLTGIHYAHLSNIERGIPTTEETWNKIKTVLNRRIKNTKSNN